MCFGAFGSTTKKKALPAGRPSPDLARTSAIQVAGCFSGTVHKDVTRERTACLTRSRRSSRTTNSESPENSRQPPRVDFTNPLPVEN